MFPHKPYFHLGTKIYLINGIGFHVFVDFFLSPLFARDISKKMLSFCDLLRLFLSTGV